MARRRTLAVPADVEPFRRTARQWAALDAPGWVHDEAAAAEALAVWAVPRYGGGTDPGEPVLRWFARLWLQRCVGPQYLHHADALTDLEHGLWLSDPRSKRGHPGACSVPMLRTDADVPPWLRCCRQSVPDDDHPMIARRSCAWPWAGPRRKGSDHGLQYTIV